MISLVITIDVEPDCSPTWRYSDPLTFDNVQTGIKGVLQPLFARHQAAPTYLINNVVMEDAASVSTFTALEGRFELGAHLHPEFIDPEKMHRDYAGKQGRANQCFLPRDIEYKKMENITKLFQKVFNRPPRAFRAGRFSAGANTIACLERLGYKVDTSVTPHINWKDRTRERPVDFAAAPEQPYFVSGGSMPRPSPDGRILEVPVSIGKKNTIFGSRVFWLRPYYSTYKQFIRLTEQYLAAYRSSENIVFNMMFHSNEVLPGKSPYVKSEGERRAYLDSIDRYLSYCAEHDIASRTLSELYELYSTTSAGKRRE